MYPSVQIFVLACPLYAFGYVQNNSEEILLE